MRKRLAVVDIDGTLCRSLRAVGGLALWVRMVKMAGVDAAPVEGAMEAMSRILGARVDVVLVTVRPRELEGLTRQWLARHVPGLGDVCLLMRHSVIPSASLRRGQLLDLWEDHPDDELYVIDDKHVDLTLPRLRLYRAPQDWPRFADEVMS